MLISGIKRKKINYNYNKLKSDKTFSEILREEIHKNEEKENKENDRNLH